MGSLKANELLLFNKKITAVEACKLGLVTEVYQDGNFQNEVWPKLKQWSELPVKVYRFPIVFRLNSKLIFTLIAIIGISVPYLQQGTGSPI